MKTDRLLIGSMDDLELLRIAATVRVMLFGLVAIGRNDFTAGTVSSQPKNLIAPHIHPSHLSRHIAHPTDMTYYG